jgi:hypothetical protein
MTTREDLKLMGEEKTGAAEKGETEFHNQIIPSRFKVYCPSDSERLFEGGLVTDQGEIRALRAMKKWHDITFSNDEIVDQKRRNYAWRNLMRLIEVYPDLGCAFGFTIIREVKGNEIVICHPRKNLDDITGWDLTQPGEVVPRRDSWR